MYNKADLCMIKDNNNNKRRRNDGKKIQKNDNI